MSEALRLRAPVLLLTPSVQAECVRLLTAAHPLEACALLLGSRTTRGHEVERLAEVANISDAESAFELDPLSWRSIELDARAEGLEVVGIWHSHPRTPAAPSPRDRRGAQPGWSHAITSADEPSRTRSYYPSPTGLVEQRVSSLS